jgi:hypothetical protein
MVIALRSTSTTAYATRTNTTVNAPAGSAVGDLIEVSIMVGGSSATTLTPPAGWTLAGSATNYSAPDPWSVSVTKWIKAFGAGETSWTWTHASRDTQAFAVARTGVDLTNPLDAVSVSASTGATETAGDATVSGITTVTPGALLTVARGSWLGDPITPPAGWTERYDAPVLWVGDSEKATPGATGTVAIPSGNGVVVNSSRWSIILSALRPADAGPPPETTLSTFEVYQGGLWVPVEFIEHVYLSGGEYEPPDPEPPTGLMGWDLTAANVGIAGKGLTTSDMTVQATSAWGGNPGIGNLAAGTYTRKRINVVGTLAPNANTTFNECYIIGDTANLIIPCGANITFNDCTFVLTGGGSGTERCAIVSNAYYTADNVNLNRCLITGGSIFINYIWSSGTVTNCYGYGQDVHVGGTDVHRDGFTVRAGDGVTLIGSRFDCDQASTTAAGFIQPTYGDISDVTIEDCLFEGSNTVLTIDGAKTTSGVKHFTTDLTIRNNRFRPHGAYTASPGYTVDSGEGPGPTFAVWADNHAYDAGNAPTYKGVAVGAP